MDLAADLLPLVPRPGRVIREHALRAAQVGDAHRRKQHAPQLLRREGDRHAQDAVEDPVLAEDVPERLALAEQPHIGLAQGDPVFPQPDRPTGRPDLDRTQLGVVVVRIRGQEVEDVVLARVDAGLERGPRDGRERRHGRAERPEAPGRVGRRDAGACPSSSILSVSSWSMPSRPRMTTRLNRALRQSLATRTASASEAHRPRDEGQQRGPNRGEDGEERAGQGKPGPGADIGRRLAGHQQHQQDGQE